jgi:hypothetical protein
LRDGESVRGPSPPTPSRKNKDAARVGTPFVLRGRGKCRSFDSGRLRRPLLRMTVLRVRFERSHPSRKKLKRG